MYSYSQFRKVHIRIMHQRFQFVNYGQRESEQENNEKGISTLSSY